MKWDASVGSFAGGVVDYAKKHYPMLVVKDSKDFQIRISGASHDVLSLQCQYTDHVVNNVHLCNVPISYPDVSFTSNEEKSANALPYTASKDVSAAVLPGTTSNMTKLNNLSPDSLALIRKIPEGTIPGVYYEIECGCVVIDNCSVEEKAIRISKFDDIYSAVSRTLKIDSIEIPQGLEEAKVHSILSSFNSVYNQCVFMLQETPRIVKVISNSSRQFEQAKMMLKNDLKKASIEQGFECPVDGMCISITGGRKLTLKMGDIILEEVDIIVNAANTNLLHGGGIAGAINEASHGAVQRYSHQYIQHYGPLYPGQIAVTTSGGSLKCKRIIHAVGPTKAGNSDTVCERLLNVVMESILQEGERLNAKSISIPAISSGIFGVDAHLVARCVIDSILRYGFRKSLPILSDIRVVIIDQPTHIVFAQYVVTKMKSFEQSSAAVSRALSHFHRPDTSVSADNVPVLPPLSTFVHSSVTAERNVPSLSNSHFAPDLAPVTDASDNVPPADDFRKGTYVVYIIGVSRSEPHTNQYYEKIAVFMYVCSDTLPRVHHVYMCVHMFVKRMRGKY